MARLRRRTKRPSLAFFKTRKKTGVRFSFLNLAIAALSLVLIAFIISFSGRYTRGGLQIEPEFNALPNEPLLATQYYDQNPISDIQLEILNGCGEKGLAARITDLLRRHQIDVVRADNAEHFNYGTTLLIQRNENSAHLRAVAAALGIDPTDETRVLVIPDNELEVDVTLIIGKDYTAIKAVADFLRNN